jgi:hypothetical protein
MNAELYSTAVFQVAGYDLSANDFTDILLAKLLAINQNAEVNIKSNWAELDPTSDSYILNKPIFSNSEIIVSAVWTGTGLVFDVIADAFPISGVSYPATPATVTLDASDATLDRIDLIVAIKPTSPNTIGTVGKITGTLASTLLVVPPDFDPSLYFVIKQISVKAGAAIPTGAVNTLVFDEGTEWTPSLTSNLVINTSDPSVGVNCIEATNNTDADSASFTGPAPLSTSNLDLLQFDLKLKEAVSGRSIYVSLYLAGVLVERFYFASPTGLFDDTNLGYQTISLDSSVLNFRDANYDEIVIRPFWASTGYFLDNVRIFAGSGSSSNPIDEITASEVSLNDSNLVVSPADDLQAFAESVDAALLRARGTGVAETYQNTVSVGGTTFNHGKIFGEINGDLGYFTVNFGGQSSVTVSNLTSSDTYVYIDSAGTLQQQTSEPTREDWVRKIFTMRIAIDTVTQTIIGFEYLNNPIGHYANSMRDIYSFLLSQGVPFKKDQIVTGRSTDLGFNVSAGSLLEFGGTGDIYNPNIKDFTLLDNAPFFLSTRTAFDAGGNTALPKFWDNNGVLTALGSTTLVGHRLYRFSNGNFAMQYGQGNYANMTLARAGVVLENYVLNPALKNATFFGWWIIESTATNTGGTTLTDFVEYTIGIQGGSSSGLSGALLRGNNLSDLLDTAAARTNLGAASTAQGVLADNSVQLTGETSQIINSSIVEVLGTSTTAIIRASSSAGARISLFQSGETSFIQSNKSTNSFGRIVMSGSGGQPLEFLKVRIDGSFTEKNIYHEGNLASSPTGVLADNSVQLTGETLQNIEGSLNIGETPNDTPTANVYQTIIAPTDQSAELWIGSNDASVNTEYIGGLGFYNTDNTSPGGAYLAGIKAYAASSNGAMELMFYAGRDRFEVGTSPDMIIDISGNVGIGTTTPTEKLHVNGNVKANSFIAPLITIVEDTTLTVSNSEVIIDAASQAVSAILPTVASVPVGKKYTVIAYDATNTITLATSSSQQIRQVKTDTTTSTTLAAGDIYTVINTGTYWQIINKI